MQFRNLVVIYFIAAMLSACSSFQAKTAAKSTTQAIKPVPVSKSKPAKESAFPVESSNDEQQIISIDIVGKPLPSGKFAKLKIGMSREHVEAIIGVPDRKWQQATGIDTTPYYLGSDRWLIQYAYSNEGMLTFNLSPEYSLIRILVNRAE